MRTKTSRRAWATFAAITLAAGCASGRQDAGSISTKNERVQVQVENHNWQDVAVWAVAGGARIRLGTVVTNTTGRFTLPASVAHRVNEVYLEGHRIGSNDRFQSDRFMINPGTRLVWRVENHVALSNQYIESR